MKLKGILQGVSLAGEIQNYLDFERDDGSAFRLPVPEESIKLLIDEIYKAKNSNGQADTYVQEPVDEPPIPEGATEFGGEEEEEEPIEQEDHQDEVPASESEVPPL